MNPPFSDSNTYSLYEKILNEKIIFPNEPLISNTAKDLILRLLEKNPMRRLGSVSGSNEILNHKFFKNLNVKMIEQKKVSKYNLLFTIGDSS